MRTSKPDTSSLSSSRRAQPLRQTRNNPPRSSISGGQPFGPRGSISGGLEENRIEIFPAITHFSDAITALPKELVRHFTLLKEVDAKIFTPEEDLGKLVDAALNVPLPQRPHAVEAHHTLGPTSVPMSAQASINGSSVNGHAASVSSVVDAIDLYNPNTVSWEQADLRRRTLFQHCAYQMTNMLVSLDEKNHVISTATEALNKHLARIDEVFPYIELEISEEARYGSTTHWAYPENRVPKTSGSRGIGGVNHLSAAAQHMAEEAAARSDARKQALLERKKGRLQHVESDFDDHQDGRHKEKKLHGNSKIRKAADASLGVGLGITNGAGTNGNPPKRRKVEKGPTGGVVMEKSMSSVFGTNGTATKGKAGSPRETPGPEGKKRNRTTGTNGQTRKRNNTVTSIAMSPSLASSPVRTTFPESKAIGKASPPPTNGGRPPSVRGRQNSTQSIVEKQPQSTTSTKQNGNGIGTPDVGATISVSSRIVPEIKTAVKEVGTNSKTGQTTEETTQDDSSALGGIVVGSRKEATTTKKEDIETNGDSMQGIQTTTITTKSGRASKPSTPALSSFPEPARSRSSRNALETTSTNKRSHKKGAGAAAQLVAQQNQELDDTTSNAQDDDEDLEIDADEPTYCYCNGVSYGEMVGCDADGCEREWFHLECVGLKVAPRGNAKWYCDDCKEKLKGKRFNGR